MQTAATFFATPPERISALDEARFFGGLKTGNDTFKRTEPGRLAAIDAALLTTLAEAGARIDTVLDLGMSSGTTTAELTAALRGGGHAARMTGTDRSIAAYMVDLPMGCRALIEPGGHVLQYEILGRPLRPWRRRLDYVNGMAVVRGLANMALGRAAAEGPRDPAREVALVSPRLRAVEAVSIVEDDITRTNPAFVGAFDLVRAANILNRHYFTPDDLAKGIANARRYMRGPGSWLLALRTHGLADHRGTLFRMNETGALAVVTRYGSGSEIEDLLLA